MNYLAHGIRFVDRPWFLVGTAIPDLLSVADRRVRMRERRIVPALEAETDPDRLELAAGVLQHLRDDDWFHRTAGFHEVTGRLTRMFRETIGTDGFRCGFLGHIVTEMLIDAVLIERSPGRLDAYYAALGHVDSEDVQATVNHLAARSTTKLAGFVDGFRRVRFLEDYVDSARLLYRLNQVMQRVKLTPLPASTVSVLEDGRQVVDESLEALLPAERFGPLDFDEA